MAASLEHRSVRSLDEEALRRCEGFSVRLGERHPAGVVEEVWLGADRKPAALVVSLSRRQRVVVSVEETDAVDPERQAVRLDEHAELVDLDGS